MCDSGWGGSERRPFESMSSNPNKQADSGKDPARGHMACRLGKGAGWSSMTGAVTANEWTGVEAL